MIYGERKVVDEEGFQYKYVPKVVIKTEGGRSRKQSETYVYIPKTEKSKETLKQDHFMKSLIEGLKPTAELQVAGGEVSKRRMTYEEDEDAVDPNDETLDEDLRKILGRRVSMNEQNVVGIHFEKYNREAKPSSEVRRKIANFVLEYKETKDRAYAKTAFVDLCQELNTPHFNFVGYILYSAFSQDSAGWKDLFSLIIDHLYLTETLLTEEDLLEGMHVSLANFIDTIIDYPQSRDYAFEMFDRLGALGIIKEDMIDKYKTHVDNIQNQELSE